MRHVRTSRSSVIADPQPVHQVCLIIETRHGAGGRSGWRVSKSGGSRDDAWISLVRNRCASWSSCGICAGCQSAGPRRTVVTPEPSLAGASRRRVQSLPTAPARLPPAEDGRRGSTATRCFPSRATTGRPPATTRSSRRPRPHSWVFRSVSTAKSSRSSSGAAGAAVLIGNDRRCIRIKPYRG